MFWYFGREACGILAPRPGIEPAPSALEGEVLTRWTAREVPVAVSYSSHGKLTQRVIVGTGWDEVHVALCLVPGKCS